MSLCPSKLSLGALRFSAISSVRLLCCFVKTEMSRPPFRSYACSPFLCGLVPRHTFVSACVGDRLLGIGQVLLDRRFAKIGHSVVGRNAIDVVNVLDRPLPMHVKPRQPVGAIGTTVNGDHSIATVSCPTNAVLWLRPLARHSSFKQSALGVIAKKLLQSLLRQGRTMSTVNPHGKVGDSIVQTVSVLVDNLMGRPYAMRYQPSNACCGDFMTTKSDPAVALTADYAGQLTSHSLTRGYQPFKAASDRVVVKCGGDVGDSRKLFFHTDNLSVLRENCNLLGRSGG